MAVADAVDQNVTDHDFGIILKRELEYHFKDSGIALLIRYCIDKKLDLVFNVKTEYSKSSLKRDFWTKLESFVQKNPRFQIATATPARPAML